MRPQQLALPSRQTFLHHSCRRITPQSRFRVVHLSTTVVLGQFQSWCRPGRASLQAGVQDRPTPVRLEPLRSFSMTAAAQAIRFIRSGRGAEAPLYPYSPDYTNSGTALAAFAEHFRWWQAGGGDFV